ncbi:MAG TPA: M48 family metalloprotease [Isosphaeraceae bacterium]|jgi:predicted Zn-dependent protease|nr:M48 family metalloprotease [Isosphaeraceae bacterium]
MAMPGEYDGGRGRGFPVRWVVAAVIALFGIVSFMMRVQTNPVTGERQHVAMSEQQEMSLGLEAAPKMAAQMGGDVPSDDLRAREVRRVGNLLVERGDAGRSPYADNFHFHLLEDPRTINAFALPGGQIFITLGLFNKLDDEAELAGVLGHEIGHVIHRHAAQQMAAGQLGQVLTVAAGVGATDDRGNGRRAQMAAALANQMFQLHYSRADESQSDAFGLKAMAQAGYDPSAMLDVMKILKAASAGGRTPEFLATHPLPETRLEAIAQALKQSYPNGIPPDLTRGRSLKGMTGMGD